MTAVDNLYQALTTHVAELENTLLKGALGNPLAVPDDYKYHVRAYCVLCHAALEEYFEEVAMMVMTHSIDAWLNRRVFNDCLLSLISHYHVKIEEADGKTLRRAFDLLRDSLNEVKGKFSTYIRVENHGADLKYLQKLMEPVGVDITSNVQLLGSLQSLASERGEFAHRAMNTARVSTIQAPEDARSLVEDCLTLCEDIKNKANRYLTI